MRARLRGQNRVPRPPARMTAWVVNFGVAIVVRLVGKDHALKLTLVHAQVQELRAQIN